MDSSPAAPHGKLDTALTRLPLAWLSLAFLGGLLLADRLSLPLAAWLAAGGALLLVLAALLIRHRRPVESTGQAAWRTWVLALACLATLLLGAARFQAARPTLDETQIAWYNDGRNELLITGVVDAPPDVHEDYLNLRLRVQAVDAGRGDVATGGLLLVRLDGEEDYQYGEVLRLRGLPLAPPENGEFSYRDYLARQGIHSYLDSAEVTHLPFPRQGTFFLRWVYDFKALALARIYVLFPDPEASLLAGILLGNERGLAPALAQAFKNTGTSHIIAISGFNIAILSALCMTVFGRLLGERRGSWLALAVIATYTLLVGAEASVVRAAIMGGLGLFARQVGRRQTGLNTLAFSAALMALFNPHLPWDVGFQLSFFATLGLILYAQSWSDWALGLLSHPRLPAAAARLARPVSEYLLFTLAAQLTTLPLIAWHFSRLSLSSLLVNPLILPVQPAVMILGGLALLLGLIHPALGRLFAWLAWPFPAYTIRMVEAFDHLPGGVLVLGDFSFLAVAAFYALLFTWTFSRGAFRRLLRAAAAPVVVLTVLLAAVLLIGRSLYAAPDGRLHLIFLEAGSAEAVLIQTPDGRSLLVNGGGSPSALSSELGRRLSPFARRLDWLIIASPLEEQVGALPRTLERYPVDNALWAGNRQASYSARRLDEWLTSRDVPVINASAGQVLDLGRGARLEVLAAGRRGAVLLIEWGQFRALLPSGLDFDLLDSLENGRLVGAVDVLLLAEAGYAPLNPAEWFEHLAPQVCLLSVAAGDPSGRPDETALAAAAGRTLLRTDQNGWIEVSTDGHDFQLTVERK